MAESSAPTNGNGHRLSPEQILTNMTDSDKRVVMNNFLDVVNARSLSWQSWLNRLIDPRRDLDAECGYPPTQAGVSSYVYKDLYDRDAIGNRVVSVMPKESWQAQPLVYEDDDTDTVTPFEAAWDNLANQLEVGKNWHKEEEGSPIWNHLLHADILSGIGSFGILLMGLDDGEPLQNPVKGVLKDPNEADSPITDEEAEALENPKDVEYEIPGTQDKETKKPVKLKRPGIPLNNQEREMLEVWKAQRKFYTTHGRLTYNRTLAESLQSTQPNNPAAWLSGSVMGTDAQYFNDQLGRTEELAEEAEPTEVRKLIYLRAFDESLVQIVRYEWNSASPRYGLPVMYRVTLNDPKTTHGGIGLPINTVMVHWSRIIHLSDTGQNASNSNVFSMPRMQPVLNRVLDARKIYGSAAEGFWRAAVTGLAVTTHPQLGPDAKINKTEVQNTLENYFNGFQRHVGGEGLAFETLAPIASDPTGQLDAQIQAICIQLGIPQRVFMGSERGELASSQDDSSWNDRLDQRRQYYITPRIIRPFINRLIQVGVLPEPEQFVVEWPDLDSLTDMDKANIANTRTTAMAAYVSGGLNILIPEKDWLVHEMGYSEEEAAAILEAAEQVQLEQEAEAQKLMEEQGFVPDAAAEGMVDPEQRDMDHEVEMAKAKNPAGPQGGGFPPKGPPGKGGPPQFGKKPGGPPKGPPKKGGGGFPFNANSEREPGPLERVFNEIMSKPKPKGRGKKVTK